MAMEPTSRFDRVRRTPLPKKAAFPAPTPKQPAMPTDSYGPINRGDKGDSDRTSLRSHRDC